MTQHETFRGPKWFEVVKNLRLSWRLWRDPLVPTWTKLIPVAVLLYILSPIDLIPDVLFGLGQVDDLTAFLLGLKLFIDLCPPEMVRRHLDQMASVEALYRVVDAEEPAATDVAGYLDVNSTVLPDDGASISSKDAPGNSEQASEPGSQP